MDHRVIEGIEALIESQGNRPLGGNVYEQEPWVEPMRALLKAFVELEAEVCRLREQLTS